MTILVAIAELGLGALIALLPCVAVRTAPAPPASHSPRRASRPSIPAV